MIGLDAVEEKKALEEVQHDAAAIKNATVSGQALIKTDQFHVELEGSPVVLDRIKAVNA